MSNQIGPGGRNFGATQITVENYDQLTNEPSDNQQVSQVAVGGRYDFDDGGLYVGGWFEGKANGYGICTGPNCQGEYSGSWSFGFEVCGIYKWPGGTTYQGQWQNGRRHGLGVEYRGSWAYKGEWTQGNKGRYGVKCSNLCPARYEGTWANGLQDGYGSETYADGGNYQGQWFRGLRHGFGVRQSASYGSVLGMTTLKNNFFNGLNTMEKGSTQSLDADGRLTNRKDINMVRGGFVLVGKIGVNEAKNKFSRRRNSVIEKGINQKTGLFRGLLKKQKSTGDIDMSNPSATISRLSNPTSGIHSVSSSTDSISLSGHLRFGGSNAVLNKAFNKQYSQDYDGQSNASFVPQLSENIDPSVTETYMGEWKEDKRSGFGICERSDGLLYAGEWYKNQKHGYGITTHPDGTTEEGKYKNNILVASSKKKIAFVLRPTKLKERIDSAVAASRTAQQTAMKKADIAISRTATARDKAEQAVISANQAQNDSKLAVVAAKQFGALVIDPTTNTISPSDNNNLNDTESIINRIKNQSNLINLSDGQLSVPELPLRRRLSQHNEARKSFRNHSIKDDQNREFDNLHKINDENKKVEPFSGMQLNFPNNSLNNSPFHFNNNLNNFSNFGKLIDSSQSFINSQKNNLVRQSSLSQSNSQNQQQSSSLYQSQPHLARPHSSLSSIHPYTSQRPPLNIQTSFDLGKESKPMIDHMDHYQSLHNRYASTSKLTQQKTIRNRTFSSSNNLQQPSLNKFYNMNNQIRPDFKKHNMESTNNRIFSNNYQQTPDSGISSIEEPTAINYSNQFQNQPFQMNINKQQYQQQISQIPQQPNLNLQQLNQNLNNQFPNMSQYLTGQANINNLQQMNLNSYSPNLVNNLQNPMINPINYNRMMPGVQNLQSFPDQQNFQNSQMIQNLQTIPNNQNTQNINNITDLNNLQRIPNINDLQNLQSLQSLQNIQNTQNLQNKQNFQPLQNSQFMSQPNYQQNFNPQQQSFQQQLSNNIPNTQSNINTSNFYSSNQQKPSDQNEIFNQSDNFQENSFLNRNDSSSIQDKQKQLEQHYGKAEETVNDQPKRSWRTASLFRPGIPMGENKSKNDSLLKRKPSLQTNFNKDPSKSVMSREQVSVLSSAEREHRRKEAELAQKLARNPFLYFTHSQFRDWLLEQQLIIIVLAINLIVALVCYHLFFTEN